MGREQRRHTRYSSGANVLIVASLPDGEEVSTEGACLDVSQSGILVKIDHDIPIDTVVSFRIKKWDLEGWATVRNCGNDGEAHLIGLEFNDGLQWVPHLQKVRAHSPSIIPVLMIAFFAFTGLAIAIMVSTF